MCPGRKIKHCHPAGWLTSGHAATAPGNGPLALSAASVLDGQSFSGFVPGSSVWLMCFPQTILASGKPAGWVGMGFCCRPPTQWHYGLFLMVGLSGCLFACGCPLWSGGGLGWRLWLVFRYPGPSQRPRLDINEKQRYQLGHAHPDRKTTIFVFGIPLLFTPGRFFAFMAVDKSRC